MIIVQKPVYGCCVVTLHYYPGQTVSSIHVDLQQGFFDSQRIGYDCLIRAIGDALLEAGVDINESSEKARA